VTGFELYTTQNPSLKTQNSFQAAKVTHKRRFSCLTFHSTLGGFETRQELGNLIFTAHQNADLRQMMVVVFGNKIGQIHKRHGRT
jgi:hypothetical protein